MKGVEHTSEQEFDRTYALKVEGRYLLVQKMPPYLNKGSTAFKAHCTINIALAVVAKFASGSLEAVFIDQLHHG